MGYYIETGSNHNKANWLIENQGGAEIFRPSLANFHAMPEDKALICVVNNYAFEAAGLCFSEEEFKVFSDPRDSRPMRWIVMDKAKAHELSGYKEAKKAGV